MTHFNIDFKAEQPDRVFVEVDSRVDVAIVRTEAGLTLQVFPRTEGGLWDEPFTSFEVDEAEITALEAAMEE